MKFTWVLTKTITTFIDIEYLNLPGFVIVGGLILSAGNVSCVAGVACAVEVATRARIRSRLRREGGHVQYSSTH